MERIKSYAPFVGKMYLIDNSDRLADPNFELNIANSSTKFIKNHENEGIAKALNVAAKMAIADGYDWLLTMDQDSSFTKGDFQKYVNCAFSYQNLEKVGMFGVEHESQKEIMPICNFTPVSHLITSGSLVNLKIYASTKGFDENLFIDHVDHEYCFQLLSKGFKIMKVNNILLDHNLGSSTYNRSLKNFKKTVRTLHAPVRVYYILRNYLYLKQKYKKQFRIEFAEITAGVKNSIKNNLLYNRQRGNVLKYIFRAIQDFRKGKIGKIF